VDKLSDKAQQFLHDYCNGVPIDLFVDCDPKEQVNLVIGAVEPEATYDRDEMLLFMKEIIDYANANKKKLSAVVVESFENKLHLFVFSRKGFIGGKIIWHCSGYEESKGQLTADINRLIEKDTIEGWKGDDIDPQIAWNNFVWRHAYGWCPVAIIKDGKLILFPAFMGRLAKKEFYAQDKHVQS
jgi:hypothetical protein